MSEKRGGLARLAAATDIDRAVLRRAACGEGPLSLAQAVLVARELGVRVESLDLEHGAARARARRAASKTVAS